MNLSLTVSQECFDDLVSYLTYHEEDIATGINDFAELKRLFVSVFGRLPKVMEKGEYSV